MNKNLEIQKIKVSSIDEMFTEMRKLKTSGGEWKVLEKHAKWTLGGGRKNKDSTSGFILSNGKKKVDIVCEEDDYDLVKLDTIFGGKEDYQKLREIFPEDKTPFLSRKSGSVGYTHTSKRMGEISKEHTTIMRVLNAWSLNDVRKILVDYYVANKAEIDQFNENNYSHGVEKGLDFGAQWLEVDEDDQLFYIWVGKRDPKKGFYRGGGEWEICLRKSDLVGKYDKSGHKLIECAGSQGVQTLREFLNVHWLALTDVYGSNRGNKYTIANFENRSVGFDPDCCDQNGNPLSFQEKVNNNKTNDKDKKPDSVPEKSGSDIQAKEQVRRYMEQNDIFWLTLENGKLVIEYNKTSKKEKKEINSENLKTIQNYLKEHNNSVYFEQLKSNPPTNANQPKKPDYTFWIVGGAVLILAVGILAYWIRKRKNK